MPVYYGDWSLYQPSVGSLRQCFETRCTVTIDSSVLLRVPFQANTSEFSEILLILGVIVTPDSPLFNPAHAKEAQAAANQNTQHACNRRENQRIAQTADKQCGVSRQETGHIRKPSVKIHIYFPSSQRPLF